MEMTGHRPMSDINYNIHLKKSMAVSYVIVWVGKIPNSVISSEMNIMLSQTHAMVYISKWQVHDVRFILMCLIVSNRVITRNCVSLVSQRP